MTLTDFSVALWYHGRAWISAEKHALHVIASGSVANDQILVYAGVWHIKKLGIRLKDNTAGENHNRQSNGPENFRDDEWEHFAFTFNSTTRNNWK